MAKKRYWAAGAVVLACISSFFYGGAVHELFAAGAGSGSRAPAAAAAVRGAGARGAAAAGGAGVGAGVGASECSSLVRAD
jgi:hypothetical protein